MKTIWLLVSAIVFLFILLYCLCKPAKTDTTLVKIDDTDDIIQTPSIKEDLEEDSLAYRVKNLTNEGLNNKTPRAPSPIPLLRFSQKLSTGDISNAECNHIEKKIDDYRENESQIGIEGSQESYLKSMNM